MYKTGTEGGYQGWIKSEDRAALTNLGGAMALSTETAERVEALYRERLEAHFEGDLSFGPILLEPTRDSEGKDTFQVTIVYEGHGEHPDPKKVISVMTSLTWDFEALGLPPVLIESYVSKEEYPELERLRQQMPWDEDED